MLKNRFLSVFVLAFAAGIAMPFLLGTGMEAVAFLISLGISLPLVAIPLMVFLLRKKGKTALLYLAFAGAGLLLGSGWLWVRSMPYEEYAAYEGRADIIEGTVTESGSSAESTYLEIRVERSHISLPNSTGIRLYGVSLREIRIGDSVRAECEYSKLSEASYRANSVALTANGTVISHTAGDTPLDAFRNVMLDACEELYETYDSVGIAQALTLRERSQLPFETGEGYRNAGVAHLLAISGLHLSILVLLLRRVLLALRLRKLTRECIALCVILLYCFLTGFSPSIIRASVMLAFVLIGELLLDETDSITVLFFALLLLLLVNPYALLSVGLQLSFLSCLGILLLGPYINNLQKKIRGDSKAKRRKLRKLLASLAGSFLISCGAVVFTFPITAVSFGDISYLAPISNLVFVPLFTPILAFLLLSVLFYPLLPFLGHALAFFPGVALQGMNGLFGLLLDERIGSAFIDGAWIAIPVALSALAIAAMLILPKKPIPVFFSCSVCAMVAVLALLLLPTAESSVMLKVSATEGYVYLSDGKTCVFADVGAIPAGRPKELTDSLDAYLVVQADDDSLARLDRIFQETEIGVLYLPAADSAGQGNNLTAFLELADKYGCTVHEYRYAVETELLRFYAKDARIETPDGISVLLAGGSPSPKDSACILLPTDTEIPISNEETVFYLPLSNSGQETSSGNARYYSDSIVFQNGEVITP